MERKIYNVNVEKICRLDGQVETRKYVKFSLKSAQIEGSDLMRKMMSEGELVNLTDKYVERNDFNIIQKVLEYSNQENIYIITINLDPGRFHADR